METTIKCATYPLCECRCTEVGKTLHVQVGCAPIDLTPDTAQELIDTLEAFGARGPLVTLGSMIRAAREARGWSLRDLAKRCGVSHVYIGQVERGQHIPRRTLLQRMIYELGAPPAELIATAEQAVADRAIAKWRA